jgi:hypothetical protein
VLPSIQTEKPRGLITVGPGIPPAQPGFLLRGPSGRGLSPPVRTHTDPGARTYLLRSECSQRGRRPRIPVIIATDEPSPATASNPSTAPPARRDRKPLQPRMLRPQPPRPARGVEPRVVGRQVEVVRRHEIAGAALLKGSSHRQGSGGSGAPRAPASARTPDAQRRGSRPMRSYTAASVASAISFARAAFTARIRSNSAGSASSSSARSRIGPKISTTASETSFFRSP